MNSLGDLEYRVYFLEEYEQNKIIHLYHTFHEECVHHLDGDKSFVLYSPKTKSYLVVRDIIGISPVYYAFLNDKFYFSKDIGTLFRQSGIAKVVNLKTMQYIVKHSTIPYEETMYQDIKRLPPGHFMQVSSAGKCTIKRYWKPEKIEINYKVTEAEAKEQFRTLFDKAIFNRIDDIKTTGFELSGGLDSSSIVSWVKHKKPQDKISAFSMNFKSMESCDESEYVDAMQEKYTLNLQNIAADKMDYESQYNLENNYTLNPYWPIFITYTMGFSVVEKAKELGIKTILTGQGGDNILSGNFYVLDEYFKNFQWIQLYKEVKALPNRKSFIKRYLIAPLLGKNNIQRLRLISHRIKGKEVFKDISQDIFKESSEYYTGGSSSFQCDLEQILHSTLSALMDSSYYAVAEEHFGIKFKHPFFDKQLIEFILTLPPKFKYSEGISKQLLRTIMKDILPEKIRLRRDKAEFSEVLNQQIDSIDLDDLLNNANLVKLGLIEQETLDKYKEDYLSGKMKKIIYFWQIINLEYWYRFNFIENGVEI